MLRHVNRAGSIYGDALLVFYIHSTISQLSYPLHQHHQKGRNTRRSPSRFLQRGSTAPHKVKNTKNNFIQPRNMWQIFVRRFFALDKALKTTNNCIQPHKVLKKTNNCIQPRNICMPFVIRIHTLTTENNINLLVESDKGTPQTTVVSSDQVTI